MAHSKQVLRRAEAIEIMDHLIQATQIEAFHTNDSAVTAEEGDHIS
jgi:urease gamma subunit